jgi:ABC-type polysaccharide/polyol phosphate export permease
MIGGSDNAWFVQQAIRRDWALALSHRAPFLFDALALLAGCAMFFFLGRFASEHGGHQGLFAFAVAGLSIVRLNSAMPRLVQSMLQGLASGNLELLLGSPRSSAPVIVAESAFEILRGGLVALATILVAVAVFGAPATASVPGLLAVTAGLCLAMVLFLGFACLTAATLLVVRQGGALATLGTLAMPLIAGAYFPVSRLPQPLEAIAAVLPFRAAVELIRGGLLRGEFVPGLALVLGIGSAVFLGAGLLAFDRAVARERRANSLGFA